MVCLCLTEADPCAGDPCLNGGTCTVVNEALQCECADGYEGDVCGTGTMVTSSNGNIFHVTGPLCGKSTGHRWIPITKASDAEL